MRSAGSLTHIISTITTDVTRNYIKQWDAQEYNYREEALRKSALKCSLKGEGVDGVQCSTGNMTLRFGSNTDPSHEISET